jgi:hypothetical protein
MFFGGIVQIDKRSGEKCVGTSSVSLLGKIIGLAGVLLASNGALAQTALLPQEHPGNVSGTVKTQTGAFNFTPSGSGNENYRLTNRGVLVDFGGKRVTAARCLSGNLTAVEVTFDAYDQFNVFRPVTYSWGSLIRDGVRLPPPFPNVTEFRIDWTLPVTNIVSPNAGWTYLNGGQVGIGGYTISGGASAGYPFTSRLSFGGSMGGNAATSYPGGTMTGSIEVVCPSQCEDGVENEYDANGNRRFDGLIDRLDPGCWDEPRDPTTYNPKLNDEGRSTSQCQDGTDNDKDGLTDRDDPGCWSNPKDPTTFDPKLNDEGKATTQCQDGVDNDKDGVTDRDDPGCWRNPNDPTTFEPKLNDEGRATTQCQDKADNDGDVLIDQADPGCWDVELKPESYNPRRNSEVQSDVAKLTLSAECVLNNKNGTYTAYFSYVNSASQELTVKNSNGTPNVITPGVADRGQPTTFIPGTQKGAFALVFDGKPTTWTVKPAGITKTEATVSAQTAACKALVPRAECVDADAQGFKATMGYSNPNDFAIAIPKGPLNVITPAPVGGSQPEIFATGNKVAAFVVRFTQAFSWTLMDNKAEVNSTTPICPGGCVDTPIGTVTSQLDATAVKLSDVVKRAADLLYAQAKKTRSQTLMRKARVDGQRAIARSKEYVAEVQKLTIAFPAVVKNCPTSQPFCQSVDRGPTIAALKNVYLEMANSTVRFAARTDFKGSNGQTNRRNPLISEAKGLRDQGLVEIAKLPAVATECK